jgi:hemoglobin-like flavoprotein
VTDPALVMEQSLITIAERDVDIVPIVFNRFFAAYPKERANFYVPEASYGRMVNETLEILTALAAGAEWAPVSIARFVDLHRNYGAIPLQQYDDFVDMLVATLADAAGDGWTTEHHDAWTEAAVRLKALIAEEAERM